MSDEKNEIQTKPSGRRLWLDDLRPIPDGYDVWAKTADEAIEILKAGDIVHCSLDHDLAEEHYSQPMGYSDPPLNRSAFKEKTGYAVVEWMHETGNWCPDISVHTMNPQGGQDMLNKLQGRAPDYVTYRRVAPPHVYHIIKDWRTNEQ